MASKQPSWPPHCFGARPCRRRFPQLTRISSLQACECIRVCGSPRTAPRTSIPPIVYVSLFNAHTTDMCTIRQSLNDPCVHACIRPIPHTPGAQDARSGHGHHARATAALVRRIPNPDPTAALSLSLQRRRVCVQRARVAAGTRGAAADGDRWHGPEGHRCSQGACK